MLKILSRKECFLHALQIVGASLEECGFSSSPIEYPFPRATSRAWYFTREITWKTEAVKILVDGPDIFHINTFLNLYLGPKWCRETGKERFIYENRVYGTGIAFSLDRENPSHSLPLLKTKKWCQKVGTWIAQDLEKALGWFEEVGSLEDLIRRADSRDLQGGVSAARLRAIQEELAARAE